MRNIKKIIWAVDPYQGVEEIETNVRQTLQALTRLNEPGIRIEPVYALPSEYVVSYDFYFPQTFVVKALALEALKSKMEKISLPGLLPPRVLGEPSHTTTRTAKILITYAQETKADLIVAGTHAKHGLSRLLLGSFAEALMLYSSVPVLTVSAHAKAPQKFSHILFPTDFDAESRAVFPSVLEFARSSGSCVTVFHTVLKPILLTPGTRLIPAQRVYLAAQRKRCERAAQEFLKTAKVFGVDARLEIMVSNHTVSEAIVKVAGRLRAQLIAMAARSGRFSSALSGSITRQVVRSSPHPVWVLREKALRTALKREAA